MGIVAVIAPYGGMYSSGRPLSASDLLDGSLLAFLLIVVVPSWLIAHGIAWAWRRWGTPPDTWGW